MFIFDVNGTITFHNEHLQDKEEQFLRNFPHPFVLITGVDYLTIGRKINPLFNNNTVYTLSGNEKWVDGLLISKRIVNFENAIVQKIMDKFKCRVDYKHECRLEIPVEFYGGEGYDICDYVEETFPQLDACISTNKNAVVIHRKEYNKSQILCEYHNPTFVTDTIEKYSYDYHISKQVNTIHINSPEELPTIL